MPEGKVAIGASKTISSCKRAVRVAIQGTWRMDYQNLAPVQLARLCAQKDSEAWLEFIRRYQRPITLVILRTLREAGSTSTLLIDDLVQETYAALCADGLRLLRDFVEEYPSSLDAMVRVVAANLTHDYLRAQNAKKRGRDFHQVAYNARALAQLPSPYGQETIELHLQLKEIDATLQGIREHQIPSARDRAIFWMHFRLGMSATAIARMSTFQLTSKGVESSLRRTLSVLRTALKENSGGS
jgi:RNA polymerase sigma-70 factor (ECF subfamily)